MCSTAPPLLSVQRDTQGTLRASKGGSRGGGPRIVSGLCSRHNNDKASAYLVFSFAAPGGLTRAQPAHGHPLIPARPANRVLSRRTALPMASPTIHLISPAYLTCPAPL